MVNLQTAKTKNGKKLNTKNIHIVAFWGNKATIVVDDMYLTNNSDYTPSAVQTVKADETLRSQQIYDLQGRRVSRESMKAGVYLMGGKKVLVK